MADGHNATTPEIRGFNERRNGLRPFTDRWCPLIRMQIREQTVTHIRRVDLTMPAR